jgi:hypothetical protein
MILVVCLAIWLFDGSSQDKVETVNGYSIEEYNSDIDDLATILNRAKNYDNQLDKITASGGPKTEAELYEYNYLVDKYNAAADEYNNAATEFSDKYGDTIDGAGSVAVDPSAINLPSKIEE